jgi:hypothetical protein
MSRFFRGGTHQLDTPGLSSFLRSTMHKVQIPHGEVFVAARSFQMISSRNGLAAAKLAKVRKAIHEESKTSAEGFDEMARGFANLTACPEDATDEARAAFKPAPVPLMSKPEANAPVPKEGEKPFVPEQLFYQPMNTKAYDMTEANAALFEVERAKFSEALTEVEVPELTEQDLAALVCAGPGGQDLPIPPMIMDVLQRFGPAF